MIEMTCWRTFDFDDAYYTFRLRVDPIGLTGKLTESRMIRQRSNSNGFGWLMAKNPILNVPLTEVMRSEIALPLQHVLQLYTVGSFLQAWRNPKNHKSIEQVFDSPQQARHAVAVCAAWLGIHSAAAPNPIPGWWSQDQLGAMNA